VRTATSLERSFSRDTTPNARTVGSSGAAFKRSPCADTVFDTLYLYDIRCESHGRFYVFTVLPAPWFKRHRDNLQLKAFVDGATAAATGAITGAVVVLGARAIVDLPTAIIGLVSLVILWRFKLSEPVLVIISGVVGLLLWPLLRS